MSCVEYDIQIWGSACDSQLKTIKKVLNNW